MPYCVNGHKMSPSDKFCQICGKPPKPSTPEGTGGGAAFEGIQGISWSVIDWPFVRRWVIFNLLAVLLFFVSLYIVASMVYQTVLNAAESYATGLVSGMLGGLLGGSSGGFNNGQSGMGGLVALAWLVGIGLIALYGLLVGWGQSRLVGGRFPGVSWTTVSIFGAFAAALAFYLLWRIGLGNPFFMLLGMGAAFSAVQWSAFRNRFEGSWIWIAGNAAAGLTLWLFVPLIQAMVGSTFAGGALDLIKGDVSGILLSLLIPILIFGALVSAVTGITMNYIFQELDA